MAPFEAFYGKKCRTPLYWDEVGERILIGPEIVSNSVSLVSKIRERLLTTQSRQKSYADKKRRDIIFNKGDHVFLKVSPCKVGEVAYRLALPPSIAVVHNVFHVSNLRNYIPNTNHVIHYEEVQLAKDLSYEERPTEILARQARKLRNKEVSMVKVLWHNSSEEEATWEVEQDMQQNYLELFCK
ncbi:uncharacterized protein LOC124909742 [Impatiens glandulifera]|uniref:uncharacterized protein LOC124909742 n=1 Tax=Impatiens glandulifera TaxID=253017 RepID=UPI001FB09EAB|nr:uncharacterized protein LOC124909742 [Impatiens glandulifera]